MLETGEIIFFIETLPRWVLTVGGGVLGAIFGSFIGALVTRWPNGQSVISGRSCCDHCGETLRLAELVPVASYLASTGRCRSCGQPIDKQHFFAEILGITIGLSAFALLPPAAACWTAIFGWLLLPLALLDWRHLWLPGRLIVLLGVFGFIRHLVLFPSSDVLLAIGVAAAAFLVLEAIRRSYRFARKQEGMGAGDPKLMGAIMLWLDWQTMPFLLLGASGLGLVIALFNSQKLHGQTHIPLGTCLTISALFFKMIF